MTRPVEQLAVAPDDPEGLRWSFLRFEDAEVAIGSAVESDHAWLAEFLAGDFVPGRGGAPDFRVEFGVSPAAYGRLRRARRPETGRRVEGFAKDSNPALLECWPATGSWEVFHDERKSIFYLVSARGDRVQIVARERTRSTRNALMRVVRELTMGRIVATGGTLVHGSSIAWDGAVVVMCGPKRSGKTTLLMSLLRSTAASYVSNDRCVLRVDEGDVHVRGLPTLVSIRWDTLDRFPGVRGRLPSVRNELSGEALGKRRKLSLTPPEFRRLLGGVPQAPAGPLRALVFPRVTDDAVRLTWRRVGPAEAVGRFADGLFRATQPGPLGVAFAPRERQTARGHQLAARRRIVERVPCFECRLGGGEAPRPEECRDFLAALQKTRPR